MKWWAGEGPAATPARPAPLLQLLPQLDGGGHHRALAVGGHALVQPSVRPAGGEQQQVACVMQAVKLQPAHNALTQRGAGKITKFVSSTG